MEKIAIISDVHGNYSALKAVLNDIEKKNINIIYCLGDTIGKGARSNECIELLNNSAMLLGNWEDFLINKKCSSELEVKRYETLYNQVSDENREKLKKLPLCMELYIGGRLVRMFHATPQNAWDIVLEIDRIEKLYEQFFPSKYTGKEVADVVIYGHTHMQNMMKLYNRTLINAGSVGNSFDIIRNENKDGNCQNTTNAEYLIVEGDINSKEYSDIRFEFVSLAYDISEELNEDTNYFEAEDFKKELVTGAYRNTRKYEEIFKESYYDYNKL